MSTNWDNDDVHEAQDPAGEIQRPFPKGAYPEGSGQRPSEEAHEDWARPEGIVRPEIPKSRIQSFFHGIFGRR